LFTCELCESALLAVRADKRPNAEGDGEVGETCSRTHAAIELARRAHRGQRRESDGEPYLRHPMEVAEVLRAAGYDEDVQVAALLHDVLERSDVSLDEIDEEFGAHVAALVAAMTEDPELSDYERRKAAHRRQVAAAGPEAAAIFLADKLAKVRELRRVLAGEAGPIPGPKAASIEARVRHYERTRDLLERIDSRHPLVGELDDELAQLRAIMA
jgi:(p)ppGpp synthase/HD superfamily hydrolase